MANNYNMSYPGIPFKDLINTPQDYRPLGSVKSTRDLPNPQQFTSMNITKLFLAPSNKIMLARQLYAASKENGGQANLNRFVALVKELTEVYAKQHDLNSCMMNEAPETGQIDWVLTLQAINNEFLQHCYDQLQWNKYVPTREKTTVGAFGERRLKELKDLTAEDIPTVNVWAAYDINRSNKNFRYMNQIPPWQSSMNTRHFDRGNEGFHTKYADRASLNTPVRGYDMSTTSKTLNNWTRTGWFGI